MFTCRASTLIKVQLSLVDYPLLSQWNVYLLIIHFDHSEKFTRWLTLWSQNNAHPQSIRFDHIITCYCKVSTVVTEQRAIAKYPPWSQNNMHLQSIHRGHRITCTCKVPILITERLSLAEHSLWWQNDFHLLSIHVDQIAFTAGVPTSITE